MDSVSADMRPATVAMGRVSGVSDFSGMLEDIDRLMTSVQREAQAARDRGSDPQRDAQASGLDGRIKVTMGADGRVRELHLADDVMSMRAHELAHELVRVINAAWGRTRSDDPAAGAAAAVDMAALASRVGQLREESLQSMGRITTALTDALTRIDRRLS